MEVSDTDFSVRGILTSTTPLLVVITSASLAAKVAHIASNPDTGPFTQPGNPSDRERPIMERFSHKLAATFLMMEAWHLLRRMDPIDYLTALSTVGTVFEMYIPPLYRWIRDRLFLPRTERLRREALRRRESRQITNHMGLEESGRIPNHTRRSPTPLGRVFQEAGRLVEAHNQTESPPIGAKEVFEAFVASPHTERLLAQGPAGDGARPSGTGRAQSTPARSVGRSRALSVFNTIVYFHFVLSVVYQLLLDLPTLRRVFLRW
ncbi:hypothetical protein VTI74DRAFT_947 [Chaetomium olivicolor]